jgi:hypothetical protein
MKTVGLLLLVIVGITTLLALAIGVPPDQFTGPEWLRRSITGRVVLQIVAFAGFVILCAVLDGFAQGFRNLF